MGHKQSVDSTGGSSSGASGAPAPGPALKKKLFSRGAFEILEPAREGNKVFGSSSTGQKHGVKSSGEEGGAIVSGPSPFNGLPEDCISYIISFTSPRDACVAASVSKTFESAANSDTVWEKFLPPDYSSLFPPSRVFLSKKELYLALCNDPVLIDDGKKSFWLEKASGKRCIMLSSKEICIEWGSTPQYWQWISIPEARFDKVTELLNVCLFDIRGKTSTHVLSTGTRYSAYIVFKTKDRCPGLGHLPVDIGLGLVGQVSSKRLYFVGPWDRRGERETRDVTKPEQREDGWMEAELGEFYNEDSCDEVQLGIIETKSPYWKRGLIIQGIEFRPAKSP